MLDLFGNVFGRSKRTVQGSNSDKAEGSNDDVDKNMIASAVNPIYPRFPGNLYPSVSKKSLQSYNWANLIMNFVFL